MCSWLALNVLSSLLFAPLLRQSLKDIVLLSVLATAFFLPRMLIKRSAELHRVMQLLLLLVTAESAYGVLAFASSVVSGLSIGTSNAAGTGRLMAYGTLWEPDVFGAVCAGGLALWLVVPASYPG
ncbi:MAG: hypothetical protein ACREPI_03620, partial [Candidatus Dormibacterales bacterium]